MSNDPITDLIRKASTALIEARKLEESGKINDSISNRMVYRCSRQKLMKFHVSLMDSSHQKYAEVNRLLPECHQHVEELKKKVFSPNPTEERKIYEDSTGHGYDTVFGRFCDKKLKTVRVLDAYIMKEYQIANFVRFCELVVSLSKNLKTIVLETHPKSITNQQALRILAEILQNRGIQLHVEYTRESHDREIFFGDDWKLKLGRGLDWFKRLDGTHVIGEFEMGFRKCRKTSIDIIMLKSSPEYDNVENMLRKAANTLQNAVDYERSELFNDALHEYKEGVDMLSVVSVSIPEGHRKYEQVKERLPEYQACVENLKQVCYVEDNHEIRRIKEDCTGHGYDKVFRKCCGSKVKNIVVSESCIESTAQVVNFVRFCEMVVFLSRNLKSISLKTNRGSERNREAFEELGRSLEEHSIALKVECLENEFCNEIQFDNGWVIKSEKGLDYFENSSRYTLGEFEMSFRRCHANTIHIFGSSKN